MSAESRPPEGPQPPQTNRNGRSQTTPEKQLKETVFSFAKAAPKAKLPFNQRLRRFPLRSGIRRASAFALISKKTMNSNQLRTIILFFCCASNSLLAEVFPGREGFDRYGGYLALKGEATGHFHLDLINGRHFLITPEGHGFVSIGVSHTGGDGASGGFELRLLSDQIWK